MLYNIIHFKTLYELLCVTWLCDGCDSDSDITLFFFLFFFESAIYYIECEDRL